MSFGHRQKEIERFKSKNPIKIKPDVSIDDAVQRYIAAIDEIYYCAEQLALHMGDDENREYAKDYLDGLVSRVDDMPIDIENIRDDATNE